MTDINQLVYSLAHQLTGDWYVNTLKQSENVFYIWDRKGVYIVVRLNVYGEKNPIISLCYENFKYNGLFTVKKIGCSLEKGLQAIKNDIQNRLFDCLPVAKEGLKKAADELKAKKVQLENREHIINAVGAVFELEKHSYSRTYETYDLVGTSIRAHHQGCNNFDLTISGVSAEILIKIGILIKENNNIR